MRNTLLSTLLLFSLVIFTSCEEDKFDVRQDALTEYAVNIQGIWTLHSLYRNGEDLSGIFDASSLTLTLGDGTFSIGSTNLPFPTLKTTGTPFDSGTWSFDDDYKPTKIHFTDSSGDVVTNLSFPLYGNNQTSLGLEFSLGCGQTSYMLSLIHI